MLSRLVLASAEDIGHLSTTDMQVARQTVSSTGVCAQKRCRRRADSVSAQHQHPDSKPKQDQRPTSRRELLKGGATVGLGGFAARSAAHVHSQTNALAKHSLRYKLQLPANRTLRLLGVSELGQVPRGLTPLMAEVSKGAQLLQQVVPKMRPTVEHLLKIGMKPTDVLRMLENPALRPRNAAELQRWIR